MTEIRTPRKIGFEMTLRAALIWAAVLVVAASVVGSVWWLDSVAPLSEGGSASSIRDLSVARLDVSSGYVYRWRRGGAYTVTLWIHNASSLPLTVTGVDATPGYWEGAFVGPKLGLPTEQNPTVPRPFHDARIAADGELPISFTFRANVRPCRTVRAGDGGAGLGWSSTDVVTLHFQQLRGFPQTQAIPLGDDRFGMTDPTKAECDAR